MKFQQLRGVSADGTGSAGLFPALRARAYLK